MRIFTAIVLGVICFTSQIALAKATTPPDQSQLKKWLFVQSASSGKLEPVAGQEDTYTLTFDNVSDHILAFTDRPQRDAIKITNEEYLKSWSEEGKDNFRSNPPNAALEFDTQAEKIIIFTLNNPKYDAANKKLTYTVKRIKYANAFLPRDEVVKGELPKEFKAPTLFIDDDISWLGG